MERVCSLWLTQWVTAKWRLRVTGSDCPRLGFGRTSFASRNRCRMCRFWHKADIDFETEHALALSGAEQTSILASSLDFFSTMSVLIATHVSDGRWDCPWRQRSARQSIRSGEPMCLDGTTSTAPDDKQDCEKAGRVWDDAGKKCVEKQ